MATTDISVNGENGSLVARRLGVRLVPQNDQLPLIRAGTQNIHGQHGTHAPSATPGAPAGFLAVDLSESALVREGIHVQVIRSEATQQPPQRLDVPAGRDLKLSAVGGKGEDGHVGGNGQSGSNGIDGAPATREVDATPGTDGGDGGDAGRGSNGADGGLGGEIEICVDEDNIHLLFAVKYCVDGGVGGEPGRHGQPGPEGKGGVGGAKLKWKELVGYKYICTSSCVGPPESIGGDTSVALIRASSKFGGTTVSLLSGMRTEVVQGGNLQALIASAARAYGARRHRTVDPGFCNCKGGQGNCPGCNSKPIHVEYERVAAFDGRDGKPGTRITDHLLPGKRGIDGTAGIFVRYHDGTTSRYDRQFQLELDDFAVEDENGDGIFEPGEHILIRRIVIRNTGGMPSPKCPIPITVASSTALVPIEGNEGTAFIPGFIEPGTAVTLDGTIKLFIPLIEEPQPPGTQLSQTAEVCIQASMPWLNRKLPFFEVSKTVKIQYPVELRNFTYLQTMALGSTSRFSYEVYNKGAKAIDASPECARIVETEIGFPDDCGSLKNQEEARVDKVERQVPKVPSDDAILCEETLRIKAEALSYRRVKIRITLYLSVPAQGTVSHGEPTVDLQAIEHTDLEIQLATHYNFNPVSKFLLVTNPETTRDRVQAIQGFVISQLGMQMDEWNVGLYGGFQYHSSADGASKDVLKMYKNKTIILLDNKFDFCTFGRRSVSELCDPILLAQIGVAGTRLVFLDCSNKPDFDKLAKAAGLPVFLKSDEILSHRTDTQTFDCEAALLESMKQEISLGAAAKEIQIYTIPIKPSKHSILNWSKPSNRAEQIKSYLEHHLPQERFLVTSIRTDSNDAEWRDIIAVLRGLEHSIDMIALEPQPSETHISKFESYAIKNSLPVSDGLNSIWESHDAEGAAELSLASVSLLLRLNLEIQIFIRKNPWPNKLPIPKMSEINSDELKKFFRIHLPTLFSLLIHETPEQRAHKELSPAYLNTLLAYAVASSKPQKKRHIVGSITLPMSNRRRQLHQCLLIYVERFVPNLDMKKFRADVRGLYSLRNKGGKRDTTAILIRLVSEATQQSTHQFSQAQTSIRKILPQAETCSAGEWDRRWEWIQEAQARIKRETEAAKANLKTLNLENDNGEGIELPA